MTVNATTNIVPTYASGPTTQQEQSVSVSITAQSGSSSTVISVSATSNCSATPSSITVNHNASVGGTYSASFRNVYVYVFGTPVYATTTISGTISESPDPTAPAVSATQTFPTTEAASATGAVTLSSAGTGNATDVFQYALFPSGSSNFTTSNSFSITRGTTYYYGASRERYNGTDRVFASNQYVSQLFPYLATSTAGTISAGDTSPPYTGSTSTVTLTIGRVTNHTYYVDGTLVSGTSTTRTLPAAGGSTATYVLTVVRPIAYGGDGNSVANGSVTVTRDAEPVDAPDSLSLSATGTEEQSTTSVTATAAHASGTLQVSENNSSWSSNGASFSGKTRGTSYTFYARRVVGGVSSSSISASITVPYLATTAAGAVTTPVTSLAFGASGAVTLSVNSIPSYHAYYINGVENGTSITVPATAGTYNYQLTVARTAAGGGTGSATVARNTVSIVREAEEEDDSVSGLDLGVNVSAGTDLSLVVQRNSGTITCDPTTFQPTATVSNQAGLAYAKQRLGGTSNAYATSNLTLSNGQSVDFQMTGPAGYDDTTTGRLTIAEDHDDLSVTTAGDPGSDGDDGGGATSSGYGLMVLNGSDTQIFGHGIKSNTVIKSESRNAINGQASETFALPSGVPSGDNISTRIGIIVIDRYTVANTYPSPNAWAVTRNGTEFTIKNNTGESRPYRYIVVRY